MNYIEIIKNTVKEPSENLSVSVKPCKFSYFAKPHNCIIIETTSLYGFYKEGLLKAFNALGIPFFAIDTEGKKLVKSLAFVDLGDISIFKQKPKLFDFEIRETRLRNHPFIYNYQALGMNRLEFELGNLLSDYELREFNDGIYKEFELNINLALTRFRTQQYYGAWGFITDSFAIPRNLIFKGVFVSHSQDDDAITVSRLTLLSQISMKISKLVNKDLDVRASRVIYSMKDLLDLFWANVREIVPDKIYHKLKLKRANSLDDKLRKVDETLTKLQS